MTISLYILMGYIWYGQFYLMFTYGNNSISSYTSTADMITSYKANEIESFPIYGLIYKGR